MGNLTPTYPSTCETTIFRELSDIHTEYFLEKGDRRRTEISTSAALSIISKHISFCTLAFEWSWFVDTNLTATSIISSTFIDVWKTITLLKNQTIWILNIWYWSNLTQPFEKDNNIVTDSLRNYHCKSFHHHRADILLYICIQMIQVCWHRIGCTHRYQLHIHRCLKKLSHQ